MFNHIIRGAKLVYSASDKFQKLVKKISNSSPYCSIARAKIKRQLLKDLSGPFNLIIETSNFCNARCLMCPYQKMKRSKKIMDGKTFDAIIARIKKEKLPLNKVLFSGMGEPFTDPELITRIAEIKKLGLAVRLYTNASLMTADISRQLVGLKLDEINISFNGTNSVRYQKIMGLDFTKTIKNIEELVRLKKKGLFQKPFIQISLIVMKDNEADIKKHFMNWRGKADAVTVSRAHEWGGGIKINSKFQIPNSKFIYPCRSLWHTFVIDSNGDFVVCCRDYESKYVLGNVMRNSFAEIQKNPILNRFRQLHLKYSVEKLPGICRKCNFPYQDGVEWFLPRSID